MKHPEYIDFLFENYFAEYTFGDNSLQMVAQSYIYCALHTNYMLKSAKDFFNKVDLQDKNAWEQLVTHCEQYLQFVPEELYYTVLDQTEIIVKCLQKDPSLINKTHIPYELIKNNTKLNNLIVDILINNLNYIKNIPNKFLFDNKDKILNHIVELNKIPKKIFLNLPEFYLTKDLVQKY